MKTTEKIANINCTTSVLDALGVCQQMINLGVSECFHLRNVQFRFSEKGGSWIDVQAKFSLRNSIELGGNDRSSLGRLTASFCLQKSDLHWKVNPLMDIELKNSNHTWIFQVGEDNALRLSARSNYD